MIVVIDLLGWVIEYIWDKFGILVVIICLDGMVVSCCFGFKGVEEYIDD